MFKSIQGHMDGFLDISLFRYENDDCIWLKVEGVLGMTPESLLSSTGP